MAQESTVTIKLTVITEVISSHSVDVSKYLGRIVEPLPDGIQVKAIKCTYEIHWV